MAEEQEQESEVVDERAKVKEWRLAELKRAGYSHDLAQVLAACLDIDLHEAIEMVEQGCKPSTAARILL
jgi:hypothetical protein